MTDWSPTISVVIPTLNAGRWLPALLRSLHDQRPTPPLDIIVVDSGSTDDTLAVAGADDVVRVLTVETFTHGGARNLGIQAARGDVVVLMTQDAEPAETGPLEALIAPLADASVAGAYARQIPRDDAPPLERFFLADRFPDGPTVLRRHEGEGPPVYPATLFSNVCSAARRSTWLQFPFDETLLMSEDQQFARDTLMAGLQLAYVPGARVLHSHRYNLRQTFRRYFDSVAAFRQLEAEHAAASSARLGWATLGRELRYLLHEAPLYLLYYPFYQITRSAATLAAHAAYRMPAAWRACCSMNPRWWLRQGGSLTERE